MTILRNIAQACSLLLLAVAASASEKPNIIIFYVDDLGWQDVQLNDLDDPCPYDTPNLIKLAESGINITQGYSPAPTCAPSRAGIITGQHPAKIGMTHVDLGIMKTAKTDQSHVSPYNQDPLDLNLLTLADALKANGYRTGHSGKWHVGLNAASYGFEVVNQERGMHRSMDDRTKDFATADDKKYPLSKEKYPPLSEKNPEGISYPYDEVTDSAIQFMAGSEEQPFFLNLCHWMVHWPMLTRNGELLEYYCDKLGQPFPPKPGDMELPGQQNPYFASMVTSVDWSLGRIIEFLEKTDDPRNPGQKLIETTYLFFTSDNGGAEIKGNEILSDNAPLNWGKKHAEEGGIRVPMVITGPGIAPGSRFDGLVNQLDYFPTILTMTGSTIEDEDHKKLSGLDISPVLKGESEQIVDSKGVERDHLFWHFPHNVDAMKSAIRSGDFKLYKRYVTDDYELYKLYQDGERNDLEEANNLAEDPEFGPVVERLAAVLDSELLANHAEGPWLNPSFSGHEERSSKISDGDFDTASRQATLSVKKSGPAIQSAYVIYRPADANEKHKFNREYVSKPDDTKLPGMRELAPISEDGFSVSASIPAGIPAYCFAIIDANGFMQYSDVIVAE